MIFNLDNKKFICQNESSDCGVICLLNIIKDYGGDNKVENLRELSGTSKKGTTLLGLYQAAIKCGFTPDGIKTDIDYLKTTNSPCILHVYINNFQHYIVCYGFDGSEFIIGDPSKGLEKYPPSRLEEIWKSKSLLALKPNNSFKKKKIIKKEKQQWLLKLINEDTILLMVTSAVGLIATCIGLSMVIFLQQLIDKILPHADKPKLILGLILIGLLLMVRGVLGYIRGHFLNLQNRDFNNRLINTFYSSLLYLPKAFFSNRKTGELVARMEDTSRIQTVLAFIFGDLLKDALLVLVSFVIVFYYSYVVGIILLFTLPIFFLIAFCFHRKVVDHQLEVMAANAKKSANYINTLQGIDTIKVHNKEQEFSVLNRLIFGVFQDKIFNLGKVSIDLQLIADFVSVIIIIAVLSIGSFMVLSKLMLIGELAAIFSIVGSMLPSIGNLAFANIRIQGAKVAFDRMYEFTCIEPEFINNSVKIKDEGNKQFETEINECKIVFKILSVNNISFRFPGRKQLLKNVSIKIEKGKISSLIGESGCGKTTLFHILEKLYQPESGSITINSTPFNEILIPDWRNIIGVVPQEISIFNSLLFENICLNSTDGFKKVHEFCVQYGFDHYFSTFPQSYYTVIGEEGINLSGGQKQLIAFARALYKKPQLLLLDEPTSAMDRNMEQFVLNILKTKCDQMAILIITHRLSMAKFTDTIYILEDGIITTKGSHIDLLKGINLYSELFNELKNVT